MNVSLNWLSALLGRSLDAGDVARRLAMLGAPVEAVEALHQDLTDIVVGLVERVEPHPNADRLSVCRVNDGSRVLEVVCGAPNVAAGRRYPFAPVGAVLPGGLTLTARKLRGVTSNGMLCSARELGLGADHEGILELHTDAAPGTPLVDALPVADTRLSIEVTANRPDLLGHRGVARELGAAYGIPVKLPPFPQSAPLGRAPKRVERAGTVDGVAVTIDDTAGCPRYIAAVIRGVRVQPSPAWLDGRLRAVGARPINNVVDATNYMLYELNQPMHAFDLARLRGGEIIVRRARSGEHLVTLDGERRTLQPDMTVICDAQGPQAVAGVMGGRASEVSRETTDILLECAFFDRKSVRSTRKALKMDTEASYRFERGTDPSATAEAVRRAVALIVTVAGGAEPDPPVDVYPVPQPALTVSLRPQRVAHVLGINVASEEIERYLASLGFVAAPKDARFHVQVPAWRPDVTREVDLIEEIARLKGYDTFPIELRPFRPSAVPNDAVEPWKARIRRVLTAIGLHEARTLPLEPIADEAGAGVELQNPVSQDHARLRGSLLPSLRRAVEHNWSLRRRDIRLFEIANAFSREAGRPVESLHLAGVVTGARVPPHWSNGGRPPDYDLWDLKAIFEDAARVGGPAGELQPTADGWRLVDPDGRERGRAAEIAADRPPWAGPVYGFELDVVVRPRTAPRYRPRATTPPVERDVALVTPAGVTAAAVEAVVREAGRPLLASVVLFDEYRGAEDGSGGRSLAWRLQFRAPDRTLRDREVDQAMAGVLGALKERLGVVRREA